MDNHRNLILAIVLSFLLLLGWTSAMDYLYPQPEQALVGDRADTPSEQAAQAADGAATRHSRTGGLVDPASVRLVSLRGGTERPLGTFVSRAGEIEIEGVAPGHSSY